MKTETALAPLTRAGHVLSESGQTILEAERLLSDKRVEEVRVTIEKQKTIEKELLIQKAIALDQSQQWLQWADYVDKKTKKIVSCEHGDVSVSVTHFSDLTSVLKALETSKCYKLVQWTRDTWQACYQHLIQTVSETVRKTLEALKYPLVLTNPNENPILITSQDQILLQASLDALREISLLAGETVSKESGEDVHVDLFLEPLVKRFRFHFCSDRKTNDVAHPEWYLQQVLSWLRQGDILFEALRLPRRVQHWLRDRNMKGLLALVRAKMNSDLNTLVLEDEALFSHTLDEALMFSKEMHETFDIKLEATPLTLLVDSSLVFDQWMTLERKFAFQRLDLLFSAPQHESEQVPFSDPWAPGKQVNSVLLCEEVFIAQLQSLSMKMKLFVDTPRVQLRLYELQCELIDDFRMRLVSVCRAEERQQSRPLISQVCGLIVNSAHHLSECLEGWRDVPLFLNLQSDDSWVSNKDVFEDEVNAIKFFIEETITTLADALYFDIETKSIDYRMKTRWSTDENSYALDEEQVRLAPSFSLHLLPLLQSLSEHLEHLSIHLEPSLLSNLIGFLVIDLEKLVLNGLVMENKFSRNGCLQLASDMRQGVIPIIRRHYHSTHQIFALLSEALLLLLLPTATAILMKESLEDDHRCDQVLSEFKVKRLRPDQALRILDRRLDLMQ